MIRVVMGELADQRSEGVLRPIRSDLAPVTPGARDLGQRAGEEMARRLEQLGSLPIGGAVLTPGGLLEAAFVIHVVVMSAEEAQSSGTVQKALRNGLRRAADWGITSLALPPLGLGVGTMEPEDSAQALLRILGDHLAEGGPPLELTIVVSSPFEADLFGRLIGAEGSGVGPERGGRS